MTVKLSHDIALALQHKIEELDDIERAFVHVDYQARDGLEHKIERNLHLDENNNSVRASSPSKSLRALSIDSEEAGLSGREWKADDNNTVVY